ncbi:hypothetical protein [Streptomyces graminofaciens]|nr:hypothetical protein [Streptomyces graminofaciens]
MRRDTHTQDLAICREVGDRHAAGQARTAWAIAHNERWLTRS